MKPLVEIPTDVPQAIFVLRPLPPAPIGPFHCEALFGEPGLSQLSQVIDVAPSCARMWPFEETWPSNAADANTCAKSPTPAIDRRATAIDRPPAKSEFVAKP